MEEQNLTVWLDDETSVAMPKLRLQRHQQERQHTLWEAALHRP
jgi:hypothetical protein